MTEETITKIEFDGEITDLVTGETEKVEEKNELKWKHVTITLQDAEGNEKSFTYQSPWKIEAIKNFMWRLTKKSKQQ